MVEWGRGRGRAAHVSLKDLRVLLCRLDTAIRAASCGARSGLLSQGTTSHPAFECRPRQPTGHTSASGGHQSNACSDQTALQQLTRLSKSKHSPGPHPSAAANPRLRSDGVAADKRRAPLPRTAKATTPKLCVPGRDSSRSDDATFCGGRREPQGASRGRSRDASPSWRRRSQQPVRPARTS